MPNFILKTYNRKVRSGSKLKAKIVVPETGDSIPVEYSVLLNAETMSDYDKCITAAQRAMATLDAANSEKTVEGDWIIKDQIQDLSSALNTTEEGVKLSYVITNASANDITYLNANGTVARQPKYDSSNPNNGHIAHFELVAKCNDAEFKEGKDILIPAFDAEDLQSIILANFTSSDLWEEIKGQNFIYDGKHIVCKDLVNISSEGNSTKATAILNRLGLTDMAEGELTIDVSIPNTISALSISGNKIAYTRKDAADIYEAKDNSNYVVESVNYTKIVTSYTRSGNNDLVAEGNRIKTVLNANEAYNQEFTDAYTLDTATEGNNSIVAIFKLGNSEIGRTEVDLTFLSANIPSNGVRANVSGSTKLSWMLADSMLDENNTNYITDIDIQSTTTSDRVQIEVPSGMNLILKLPVTINNLCSVGGINDISEIGYYVSDGGSTVSGFATEGLKYSFTFSDVTNIYSSKTLYGVDDDLANLQQVTVEENQSTNGIVNGDVNGLNRYLYIPKEVFENVEYTPIEGIFNIKFVENNFSNTTQTALALIPIHFRIVKAS